MSTTLDALQSLDVPPVTVAALTLACLVLVVTDPLLGRRDHGRLVAAVATDTAGGGAARLRLYRAWVVLGWAWAASVLALVAAAPGVGPAHLGLRPPELGRLAASVRADLREDFTGGEAIESIAGLVVGLLLVAVVVLVVRRLARRTTGARPTSQGPPIVAEAAMAPMLPRSVRERRGWSVLAVTAGVTEEVTYRGMLTLTLALLLPWAEPPVVVLAAAVLFGLAHAYQGPAGMVVTGVVGMVFTGLYLATGSLLLPMVLHVLVDLRATFARPLATPVEPDGVPA